MAGTFRVVISGLIHGNTFNNVLHFQSALNPPNEELQLANIVNTHWIDNVRALMHSQVQYLNINVRSLSSPGSAPVNLPINKIGTAVAANASDQPTLCAVWRLQTAVAGRTGRGHVHLSGISLNNSQNLGILLAATITLWTTRIATIKAALLQGGSQGVALSILSRSNPLATTKSVTDIVVRPALGTMRSRNYNVGI